MTRPPTSFCALAACAAAALAAPTGAQQEHAHHPPAAESQPTPAPLRAEFLAGPVGAPGTRAVREREEMEVRVRLTDPATGEPVTGLTPMAWVDVRRRPGEETPLAACQRHVGAFIEASLHVRHGEINLHKPVDDLNGHYVVALARGGTLVVLDPVKGFGRTRMLTAVPLGAEGADWAATPDDRRIFVTLPSTGEVAVVNTHTWRVEARIPAGTRPARARMHPDGRHLWVTHERGVAVVDAERLAVVATIPLGAGPHALAFSDDGRTAFVAARGAGTVAVIDAARRRKTAEARTGPAPADVAWSSVRGAAFVVDEEEGTLATVDARGAVGERVTLAPGVRSIRFAPDPADAHAGHGGHHAEDGAAGNGPLAFVLNPRAGTLQIYDVAQKTVIRTLSGAPEPDQVAFTGSFAYVRAAGTPSVALIPLANPTAGAVGPHDYFPAGSTPPGAVADSLGDVLVPQPGMHDAVYAANPAERMVYSYHYMEGMPVPHGGLTTYAFTPKAVRVVSRRVRETEPGVYAATLRLDRAGEYDLIFRSPEPYHLGCYGFTVERDASLHVARDVRVAVAGPAERRDGGVAVRFRVSESADGTPIAELADFRVLLASTAGWRQRAQAAPLGEGVYEATFDVPEAGTYYASFEIPSRRVSLRDLSPAAVEVRP